MPNLAFNLVILDQVIAKRAAAPIHDPMAIALQNNAQLKQFAALGAMGPDLFQYTPISAALAGFLSNLIPPATSGQAMTTLQIGTQTTQIQTALVNLQATSPALAFELYFNPTGAIYSVLFSRLVVPAWPAFNQANDLLAQIAVLVQNQPGVLQLAQELPGILNQLQQVQNLSTTLKGLPSTSALLLVMVSGILTLGPWMEMNSNNASLPPNDARLNRRHEFLRWHHAGDFAKHLLQHAHSPAQKAYVFGWLCHFAAAVTAEPLINNITGGPYRTHWWRNRLAGNFVDSWTFGFFEQTGASMSGDNPTPAYFDPLTGNEWPSLCSGGNLQNSFNVGNLSGPLTAEGVPPAVTGMATGNLGTLPSQFPAEITTLFSAALTATYPAATQPVVGIDSSGFIPAFKNNTMADAYVGAFAVYWFMTSGRGTMINTWPGPGTGMPEPAWVTSGSTPSPSQAGLNVGATVCGILLAILSVLAFVTGNVVAGLAALAAALSENVVNWADVNNELFWLRKTIFDQENSMQKALVMAGLAYPPPVMLGTQTNVDGTTVTLPWTDLTPPLDPNVTPIPFVTGVPLCKSNLLSSGGSDAAAIVPAYPRWLDTRNTVAPAADLNFAVYPAVNGETPPAKDLIQGGIYPQTLVNGLGLLNSGLTAAGAYPSGYRSFGDAVSNANQVIGSPGAALHNYNLDGDRGYGWHAWDPAAGSNPFNPPVQDVPEV